jgi:hypothetical protein
MWKRIPRATGPKSASSCLELLSNSTDRQFHIVDAPDGQVIFFLREGACHRSAASKIAYEAPCGSAITAMRPIFSIVIGGIHSVAPRF